jgi:hypothetical protein
MLKQVQHDGTYAAASFAHLRTFADVATIRSMNRFKDAFGRFVPPRATELFAFGLATFVLASVPVAWFLHGFANVREPWNALPVAGVLIGGGLWMRRKRLLNTRPISPETNVR